MKAKEQILSNILGCHFYEHKGDTTEILDALCTPLSLYEEQFTKDLSQYNIYYIQHVYKFNSKQYLELKSFGKKSLLKLNDLLDSLNLPPIDD